MTVNLLTGAAIVEAPTEVAAPLSGHLYRQKRTLSSCSRNVRIRACAERGCNRTLMPRARAQGNCSLARNRQISTSRHLSNL